MYRAGKALEAMSRFSEAAEVLARASRLSPTDAQISRLLSRAKRSAREQSSSQKAAFGGMFSKSAYIMDREKEEARASAERVAERTRLEAKLKQCIQSSDEVSLLERWVQNGMAAFKDSGEEAEKLVRVAQRAAASGQVDQASERALLSKHGLEIRRGGGGGAAEENGRREGTGEDLKEQQELLQVQMLTKKVQDGHPLEESEATFLEKFRAKEIRRLESQLRSTGLGERDRLLLQGLKDQAKKHEARSVDLEKRSTEVQDLLRVMESGRRVPLRQRLRMDELLNEERVRLEQKDDDCGLTGAEWKILRQIQEGQDKRKKEEMTRREALEQRKKALQQRGLAE